jgi:hypothetical protein
LRLKGTVAGAAACLAACATGAWVAVAACIPDLPPDASSAADASLDADAAVEAAPPSPPRCGDGIIQLDRGEHCDPGLTLAPDASSQSCTGDCQIVCSASPAGFVWSENDHCYSFDGQEATSLDQQAVGRCTAGSHVVTFASEDEFQAAVANLQPGAFWVGLDPVVGSTNQYTPLALFEPGWDPTCTGCYAHSVDAAAPLPGGPQSCVEALSDAASWQQYPCDDAGKIHVVCEREPTGVHSQSCDAGVCIDLVWTHAQKRYVFVSTKTSGDDAETQCAALGGTLVVLQSRDEREQLWHELAHMAGRTPPGSIWIGLSLRGGAWVWEDDASPDAYPPPWGDKQPGGNGSRAYLVETLMPPTPVDTTLAKNDVDALTLLPFVCQVPASTSSF